MQTISRNYCVFSKKSDLELLYSFKDFPVFVGCVEQPLEQDVIADMNWYISKSTGSLQLNPLLPLEILYPEQHEAGAVGGIWATHHQKLAEFMTEFNCRSVFEIGAAHGILSKNFQALRPHTEWTILEPNLQMVEGVRARVIRGFFDDKFSYDGVFDAVVHSQVLEHTYFPSDFISQVSKFIPTRKYHIFSIPDMMTLLKNFFTNCLNFEHTFFLIEPYTEYLLAVNGFKILKKEYFLGHSIFYATQKVEEKKKMVIPNLYRQNKELFNNFVQYHNVLIKDLNQKINNSVLRVYLFGAHIFSQYLINFGLNAEKIVCVLDNSSKKAGKRLYGTRLQVESPKILKDEGAVNIILKAGHYNEEIKSDILANINPKANFWE